jgi:hypothetical protein
METRFRVSLKRAILALAAFSSVAFSAVTAQAQPIMGTMTADGQGHTVLAVQNLNSAALTAYGYEAVVLMTTRGRTAFTTIRELRDAALDLTMQPILPNQADTRQIPGKSVRQLSFKAAVWADGTTFGDPAWVQKLLQRRVVALRHAESIVALLEESIRFNRSPAVIVAVAKQGQAQVLREVDDPDDAARIQNYYAIVIRSMTEGSPAPDQDRIAGALTALVRVRDHLKQ